MEMTPLASRPLEHEEKKQTPVPVKKPAAPAPVMEEEEEPPKQLETRLAELKSKEKVGRKEKKKIMRVMVQNRRKREGLSMQAEILGTLNDPALAEPLSEVIGSTNTELDSYPLRRCTSPSPADIMKILPERYSRRWDLIPRICQQRIQWLCRRSGVDVADLQDIETATAIRVLKMKRIEKAKQVRQQEMLPTPPREVDDKKKGLNETEVDRALEPTSDEGEEPLGEEELLDDEENEENEELDNGENEEFDEGENDSQDADQDNQEELPYRDHEGDGAGDGYEEEAFDMNMRNHDHDIIE